MAVRGSGGYTTKLASDIMKALLSGDNENEDETFQLGEKLTNEHYTTASWGPLAMPRWRSALRRCTLPVSGLLSGSKS